MFDMRRHWTRSRDLYSAVPGPLQVGIGVASALPRPFADDNRGPTAVDFPKRRASDSAVQLSAGTDLDVQCHASPPRSPISIGDTAFHERVRTFRARVVWQRARAAVHDACLQLRGSRVALRVRHGALQTAQAWSSSADRRRLALCAWYARRLYVVVGVRATALRGWCCDGARASSQVRARAHLRSGLDCARSTNVRCVILSKVFINTISWETVGYQYSSTEPVRCMQQHYSHGMALTQMSVSRPPAFTPSLPLAESNSTRRLIFYSPNVK